MPLIQNFSATQTIGVPSVINLTDTSTGTDVTIVTRSVYILTASGSYLTASGGSYNVPTFTPWVYTNATISIDCLPQDLSLNIRVDWLDINGAVIYTKTILFDFTMYGLLGSFSLTQDLSAAPNTIQDTNYWMNRMILRCNIDDADNAVFIGGNQFISQAALDREAYMLANQNLYF